MQVDTPIGGRVSLRHSGNLSLGQEGCMGWGQILVKWLTTLVMVMGVGVIGIGSQSFGPFGIVPNSCPVSASAQARGMQALAAGIAESSPPATIQEIRWRLDQRQPQVEILSPASEQMVKDDTVAVKFKVKDLPIYKDEVLGLGPHLHVFLDDQPYRAVYDLSQPLVLKDLTPGSHTIRAFASRPWHESFKNKGAYSQVTFYSFVKTPENTPEPRVPLLTYSRPQGEYGAEPVMLDFYLTHVSRGSTPQSKDSNWQVRVTVNGDSFSVKEWTPLYLSGLKPGHNWVRLDLLDQKGRAIANAFNDTARLISLKPEGQDTLAQLVRGEIPSAEAIRIVDPNYTPPPITETKITPAPEALSAEAD